MGKEKKIIRKKRGVVISDKLEKTIIVAVTEYKTHPKYLKKYRSTKKYKVHDEENKFKVGDTVEFIDCKPISRDKKFIAISQSN